MKQNTHPPNVIHLSCELSRCTSVAEHYLEDDTALVFCFSAKAWQIFAKLWQKTYVGLGFNYMPFAESCIGFGHKKQAEASLMKTSAFYDVRRQYVSVGDLQLRVCTRLWLYAFLLQSDVDVLACFSKFNFVLTEQPTQSEEHVLLGLSLGSLLEVFHCEGTLFVEGFPYVAGEFAYFLLKHLSNNEFW